MIPDTCIALVLILSVAAIPVSAEPSIAGNAPVKLLAASEPLNVLAVIIPALIPDPLIVTADPTIAESAVSPPPPNVQLLVELTQVIVLLPSEPP